MLFGIGQRFSSVRYILVVGGDAVAPKGRREVVRNNEKTQTIVKLFV